MSRLDKHQKDSSLTVVRFDAEGLVVFENAVDGTRIRLDPDTAMRTIIDMPVGRPIHQQSSIVHDWIINGWKPSLEYFLWSEQLESADVKDVAPIPSNSETRIREWHRLPDAAPVESELTIGNLLLRRRTARVFDPKPVSGAELAGIIGLPNFKLGVGVALRLLAYNLDGILPGVWSIDENRQAVSLDAAGNFRETMSALMCGMPAPRTAAMTLVLVVDMAARQRAFPYERALRELYIEMGEVGQYLIVAAEKLGLSCLITPATNDRKLAELLKLENRERPVYTITIGHARASVKTEISATGSRKSAS